jgi:hypothetical protein
MPGILTSKTVFFSNLLAFVAAVYSYSSDLMTYSFSLYDPYTKTIMQPEVVLLCHPTVTTGTH